MRDRQGHKLHKDGTRRGDTNLQRSYDRVTGLARRNKRDYDTIPNVADSRGRNVFKGEGTVFETDPFFNPWAEGGAFNP